MDFLDISGEVEILLEGNEKMRFLKKSIKTPFIPSEEQIQKKILGIELSYSFYRWQDNEISRIKKAFGADKDGIIRKMPKGFIIETFEDICILKYGSREIAPGMLGLTEKVGITGYWDNANIIICILKKYEPLFNNIQKMFRKNGGKFDIRLDSWGPNFRIISLQN